MTKTEQCNAGQWLPVIHPRRDRQAMRRHSPMPGASISSSQSTPPPNRRTSPLRFLALCPLSNSASVVREVKSTKLARAQSLACFRCAPLSPTHSPKKKRHPLFAGYRSLQFITLTNSPGRRSAAHFCWEPVFPTHPPERKSATTFAGNRSFQRIPRAQKCYTLLLGMLRARSRRQRGKPAR